MSELTKESAEAIASKLHAKVDRSKKNRPHDLAVIYYNDMIIASFGIRRGSKKNSGHDHIPRSLHITMHDAKMLDQCPLKYEGWIEKMKARGIIP